MMYLAIHPLVCSQDHEKFFREAPHACVVLISDLENKMLYSVLFNTNGAPMTVHRTRHRHSYTMKLPQNLRELISDILNTNSPSTNR